MASEYNSRPLVPEVLVHGDHYAVVRARPSFDEMLERDTIPDWLERERLTEGGWRDRESGADEGGAARRRRGPTPGAGRPPKPRRDGARILHPRLLAARRRPLAALWAALAFGLAEILTRTPADRLRSRSPALAARSRSSSSASGASAGRARRTRGRASTRPCRDGRSRRCATRRRSARDDPGAQAVWAAHLARMRRLAAQARAVPADLRLAARDPWALRLVALVLLARRAASSPATRRSQSVQATLRPDPAAAVAAGPTYEGWAEPPAYTGRPTLYLPEVPGGEPVSVPQGTVVTLRVYGEAGRFALAETVSGALRRRSPRRRRGSPRRHSRSRPTGRSRSARAGATLGAWSFAMEPDAAPTIAMKGRLDRAPTGETRLPTRRRTTTASPRPARDHARPRRRSTGATGSRPTRSRGRRSPPTCRMPMAGAHAAGRRDHGRGFLEASLRRPAGDGAALGRGRDRADRRERRRRRRCCRCAPSTTRWRWRSSSSAATCCGRRRTPGG